MTPSLLRRTRGLAGMEADEEGKKVKIKKLHKRVFDAIQLKRTAAQLKRAVEILAVDPKDYRALSYVAARACKQVNSITSTIFFPFEAFLLALHTFLLQRPVHRSLLLNCPHEIHVLLFVDNTVAVSIKVLKFALLLLSKFLFFHV